MVGTGLLHHLEVGASALVVSAGTCLVIYIGVMDGLWGITDPLWMVGYNHCYYCFDMMEPGTTIMELGHIPSSSGIGRLIVSSRDSVNKLLQRSSWTFIDCML